MLNNLCLGLENVNKEIRKNKVPEMTLQHLERKIELLFYLGDYYIVSFGVRTSTSAYSCMLSLCGIQVMYIIFEGCLFFPGNAARDGLLSFSEFYNGISLLYKILESELYWLKDSQIATFCCSSLPFTEVRNVLYQLVLA